MHWYPIHQQRAPDVVTALCPQVEGAVAQARQASGHEEPVRDDCWATTGWSCARCAGCCAIGYGRARSATPAQAVRMMVVGLRLAPKPGSASCALKRRGTDQPPNVL